MRSAAKLFSFLTHPLLVPTVLVGVLGVYFPQVLRPVPVPQVKGVVLLVFVITFALPALNFLFLKTTGVIKNIEMPTRRDRLMPLVFMMLLFGTITFLIRYKLYIPMLFNIMALFTVLTVVSFAINFFFKISLHAMGSTALAGMLLWVAVSLTRPELLPAALLAIVFAGASMSARLFLRAHTLEEIGWGAAVGILIGTLGLNFLM